MTVNSISTIASTPVCGLATQTYNVTTTGNYTVQATFFPPWQTSDQPTSTASGNVPTSEVQTVTTVADSSGSLNSTYWTFYSTGNAQLYYVWYNINSAGVDPAVTNAIGIKVSAATGASANTIASNTNTAINTAAIFGVGSTVATDVVTVTNSPGKVSAAADGTAATGFTFAVSTTGTFGYASGLVVTVKHGTTQVYVIGPPSPSQALLAGSTQVQATAGDTITVISSSLSNADAPANAVKGIVNVFLGPI